MGALSVRSGNPATGLKLHLLAFEKNPAVASNLSPGHRFHAACAAVRVGTEAADGPESVPPSEKAALRQRALGWLREEFEAWRSRHEAQRVPDSSYQQTLRRWLAGPSFAWVREAPALSGLPEEERVAWQELWVEVRAALSELGQ
jgi:hypothetical protein